MRVEPQPYSLQASRLFRLLVLNAVIWRLLAFVFRVVPRQSPTHHLNVHIPAVHKHLAYEPSIPIVLGSFNNHRSVVRKVGKSLFGEVAKRLCLGRLQKTENIAR